MNYCVRCALDVETSCPKCGASVFDKYRSQQPLVCLPLMKVPTREVEKGTKYLPEMWKPG
jgi:hypothetical protein